MGICASKRSKATDESEELKKAELNERRNVNNDLEAVMYLRKKNDISSPAPEEQWPGKSSGEKRERM